MEMLGGDGLYGEDGRGMVEGWGVICRAYLPCLPCFIVCMRMYANVVMWMYANGQVRR
jgi:hypothetical protein